MPDEPFKKKEPPASPDLKRGESFANLRTMREDIASLSQRGQSPADMIARETPLLLGQKEQLAREFTSERRWHIALIASIAAALFIGAGIIGFFLFFPKTSLPEEEITPAFLPFPAIHQEEIRFRLGDREGFLALLNQKIPRVTADREPVFLSFRLFSLDVAQTSSRQASTFEVFQTLRFRPPSQLLQTFTQEIYPYILARSLVFVIPINNPQKALEGFLAWEPLMARDFAPLLPADIFPKPFEDRIIGNVDTRISSSLNYALFGGRYAIIALSKEALEATIERLSKR